MIVDIVITTHLDADCVAGTIGAQRTAPIQRRLANNVRSLTTTVRRHSTSERNLLPMIRCPKCASVFDREWFPCPECGSEPELIDGIPALSPDQAWENDGFSSASHLALDTIQEQSFWFRERNALISEFITRYASETTRAIEIGCGTGYVLNAIRRVLPAAHLSGAEIHVSGLVGAGRRLPADIRLMQMDAREMPFVTAFDMICAFDVLEHITEDDTVLERLFEATNPGGTLLVSVPQHMWLWSKADEVGFHKRRYAPPELMQKVRAAGFEIVRNTSFVTILLPLMAAQRLLAARRKGYDGMEEFNLPVWLDRLFATTLKIERVLIRLGLNLPIGGTRFIVAHKPVLSSVDASITK